MLIEKECINCGVIKEYGDDEYFCPVCNERLIDPVQALKNRKINHEEDMKKDRRLFQDV